LGRPLDRVRITIAAWRHSAPLIGETHFYPLSLMQGDKKHAPPGACSVASLHPRHTGLTKRLGQHWFEFGGFPAAKGIEMAEKLRKQAYAEAVHKAARLVSSLVLIKSQVGIERCLADVE